jgi:NitT/TauT family transport system ATP-binding protein
MLNATAQRAGCAATAPISVRSVSKVFPVPGGELVALDDISLEVEPGQFVTLLGPSGCGKSTLLRAIGGLLDVEAGDIHVGDDTPTQARRTKRFAWVPQTAALVPWRTVLGNVTLPLTLNRRGAPPTEVDPLPLLEAVGLGDFVHARPRQLSGGMQQRVSLARGFAQGADVLLMDEPFAALDEITRTEMRYLLLDVWEERRPTVVFVTHSLNEAVMLSDRVVVLTGRPGRVSDDVTIDLPRPRSHEMEDSPRFAAAVQRLRQALYAGARAA